LTNQGAEYLDGQPLNIGYINLPVIIPTQDSIGEFKVQYSNLGAEWGKFSGAVSNFSTKSGSNSFHGELYEFLRNKKLNANDYFYKNSELAGGASNTPPPYVQNNYGFNVGGPIIKNKLFYFADYEGFRQLQRYLNFDSIPSMSDRSGTLPVSVYDPLNKTLYAAVTQIPVSQLNSFAATVLGNLPSPNGTGRSNNYEALLLVRDYSDKYDAKINYNIDEKMTAFLRFSQRKDLPYYAPDIPGPSGGNGNGHIHAIQQQAAAGYTWSLTPTSLIEARFAFDHILAGKTPPYLGGASMEDLYGFSGLPSSSDLTGGLNSQSISGFSQLGRQTSNPQFQNPTSFNPKLNYSWMKGRHSLKMGYEFVAIRTEVLDVNQLRRRHLRGPDEQAHVRRTRASRRLHDYERFHELQSGRLHLRIAEHDSIGQPVRE